MSGNTFGKLFQVTTYGESHGKALGCIIDGCPPQVELSTDDIQSELNRRKPGQSDVTTQRKEDDIVEILSGVFEGKTLGTPISLIIYNLFSARENWITGQTINIDGGLSTLR